MRKILTAALMWTVTMPAVAQAPIEARHAAAIAALEGRMAALPRSTGSRAPAPLVERMAEARVPAVSIAVIEGGRVVWARAYGTPLAGSDRRVTPETRFQAASMSKAVAAAGALALVDRGHLALDADIAPRLRGWRVPMAPGASTGGVTLRRLLSHTAGLSVSGYPGYAAGTRVPSVVASLSGLAPASTPAVRAFAAPGTQLAYSGGGYTVAQLAMSEAGGGDFARLMQRTVLRPAGMTRSTFDHAAALRDRTAVASGHDSEGKPIAGGSHAYPELAAAGLWTTPSDYARFLIALQRGWASERGALLKPATARAMTTPVMGNYALGVITIATAGRTAITHGGSNEGFQCRFVAFLDSAREGLVVMTNGDNGGALAAAIVFTVGKAYGWPDAMGPPTPRAPDE